MIRIPMTNPKAIMLGGTGFMAAWAASGYSTDSKHLILAVASGLTGSSVPHNPTSSPNVLPDSHIVTPYVNNIQG